MLLALDALFGGTARVATQQSLKSEAARGTLGGAVARVRGLSLHQYIRLKRLWTIRARLLNGGSGLTVANCARAQGFHHMGEFAAIYRATYKETPRRRWRAGGRTRPLPLSRPASQPGSADRARLRERRRSRSHSRRPRDA